MANGDVNYDSIIEAQLLELAKLDVLKNDVDAFRTKYQEVLTNAKNKEEWKTYSKAMADGLTGVTRGTISAVNAFKQTPIDPVAGSAAIMDICSGLASAVGNIPGPVGAIASVFGALFSMISSILNACAPKPPSLLEQIGKLLRDIDTEHQKEAIQTAGDEVYTYADACDGYMVLDKHGKFQEHAVIQLRDEVAKVNTVDGNLLDHIHTVQHWLEEKKNQDLKGWPEVLSLLCETYMHLWRSLTAQVLFSKDPTKRAAWVNDLTQKTLNDPDPATVWEEWQIKLEGAVNDLKRTNVLLAQSLHNIVPVARMRGIYVHAQNGGSMFVTTGTQVFKENNWKMFYEHCGWMSISAPREGVNQPDALYDAWVWDSIDSMLTRGKLDGREAKPAVGTSDTLGYTKYRLLDCAAIPGVASTFAIYAASDDPSVKDSSKGAMQYYTWDQGRNFFAWQSWELRAAQVLSQVRAVSRPALLDDDPDTGNWPDDVVKNGASILYGTLDGSNSIFVAFTDSNGQQWRVAIPYDVYSGIAVDQYFLWVYGARGFACATHASVMRCIEKKRTVPRWLGNDNPDTTGFTVRALGPCADGTLLVSTPDKLRAAVYRVDFTQGDGKALIIDLWDTSGATWQDLAGGEGASQVHKLPIYGWPQIASLMNAVNNPGNRPPVRQLSS